MVLVLPQPAVSTSLELTLTEPQVSLAVALPLAATLVSAGHSSVWFSGKLVQTGGVVSTTVIVWSRVISWPHWSTAFQVRTMVLVLPQPAVSTSLELTLTEPQVSLAVALPLAATLVSAGHSSVWFSGKLVQAGSVLSTTVMIWTAL